MHRDKVLIVGSGNVTGMNVIKALLRELSADSIIGCDVSPNNAANMLCENVVVPAATDENFPSTMLKLMTAHGVSHVIACDDFDVRALMGFVPQMEKINVKMNGAAPNALNCLDKLETSRLFSQAGAQTPELCAEPSLADVESGLVVRARFVGARKKFTHIVKSKEQWDKIPSDHSQHAVVTKFYTGTEYTVDVLSNDNADALVVVPRLRHEVRNYIVHYAEAVKHDDIIADVKRLVKKLGLIGIMCIQCIVNDEGRFFFEVNPRPGSGIDLTVNAGANLPCLWLKLSRNADVGNPQANIDWGLKLLRYHDGYFFK